MQTVSDAFPSDPDDDTSVPQLDGACDFATTGGRPRPFGQLTNSIPGAFQRVADGRELTRDTSQLGGTLGQLMGAFREATEFVPDSLPGDQRVDLLDRRIGRGLAQVDNATHCEVRRSL